MAGCSRSGQPTPRQTRCPTPLGHRAASANVIADDAVSDQDSEQDTGPGDETENILPAAMLLAENPLVDHLK